MAEKTLLDHLEKIIDLTGKAGFNQAFFEKASAHLKAVAATLKITEEQSALFAHFLNLCDDDSINLDQIARSIHCNRIQLVRYMDDIDELEQRRLIRCCRPVSSGYRFEHNNTPTYRVPQNVINAVRRGVEFVPETHKDITIEEFFDVLCDLFQQRRDGELSYDSLVDELQSLCNDNPELTFCQRVKWYRFARQDGVLFMRFCDLFINEDDDANGIHDFEDIFPTRGSLRRVEKDLRSGEHSLFEAGLVEFANNDGFGDNQFFHLTDKAKEEFFSELNIKEKMGRRGRDFILVKDIKGRELFYNDKERRQVDELSSLLNEENFKAIVRRLGESSLRGGFACLFYGPPGTGKTETAYQIARATGRDLLPVDITQTKSKWFGDSEKQVKHIFDRYRGVVKAGGLAPILLFNEADAVISRRTEVSGANASIEKTLNAVQNIILDEMEKLDGILIATTNLTQNMDAAFERRFIYKIEFTKPTIEARTRIWLAMNRTLSEHDAGILAGEFDFSGGQIENITRKRAVYRVIHGDEAGLEVMREYCREELWSKRGAKIGFR
jgi:hypothetical protein